MSDDPLEIKPSIVGVTLNLNEIWRRWRAKPEATSVVVRRFLDLFQSHGVGPTQMQRLLPEVTLDKIKSPDALLALLSNEMLDRIATLFGVRREWLEGIDEQIYPHRFCYKAPRTFFEGLAELDFTFSSFPVRALHSGKGVDARDDYPQNLVLILVERIAEIGDEEIHRYRIYSDAWDWDHPPCRIQLKAMARLVNLKFGCPVPLYPTEGKLLEKIREGQVIPRTALKGCLLTEPSLEDFALGKHESAKARETEEIPAVLDYIQNNELEAAINPQTKP